MRTSPTVSLNAAGKPISSRNFATNLVIAVQRKRTARKQSAQWAAFWRAFIALYNGVWSKR